LTQKFSKILIAEDDPDILLLYREFLEGNNHKVITTEDGEKCIKYYEEEFQRTYQNTGTKLNENCPFDVVILDYRMPKINGLLVAKRILLLCPNQRIIFVSAYLEGTLGKSIKHLGKIVELIEKPLDFDDLLKLIENDEIFDKLKTLNVNIQSLKSLDLTYDQIKSYLDILMTVERFEKEKIFVKPGSYRRIQI